MADNRRKRQEHDDDDGHVIAPMNIEGMPWYRKNPIGAGSNSRNDSKYSQKETFYIIMGTLKAALLIAGAFIGVFFLFILLLTLFP